MSLIDFHSVPQERMSPLFVFKAFLLSLSFILASRIVMDEGTSCAVMAIDSIIHGAA